MRRAYKKGFLLFLLCSIAIHFLLTFALPNFLGTESGIIPIQLLTSRELEVDILPESGVQSIPQTNLREEELDLVPEALDPMVLEKKLSELSLAENLKTPSSDVLNPPFQKGISKEERIQHVQSSPFYEEIAKTFAGRSNSVMNAEGSRFSSAHTASGTWKEQTGDLEPKQDAIMDRMRSVVGEKPSDPEVPEMLGIAGPVVGRKLIFRPHTPGIELSMDAELQMKFWVRPDGTVDRVVLLNEAVNAELEEMAVNYVKGWHFEPIPEDRPQEEQWGRATIILGGGEME